MLRVHARVLSLSFSLLGASALVAGCGDAPEAACEGCPPAEADPTEPTPNEPGPGAEDPAEDPTEPPATSSFLGSFDCVQTSETFVGHESSGPTSVNLLLEVTAVNETRVRLLSPGTRQNLFQGCATLLETDGFTATHAGGDGCDNGFSAGAAAADPSGLFTADFDGNFAGYRVDVTLECEPRATPAGGADGASFLGDWACGGTQEGPMGATEVDFRLRFAATTGNGLAVTSIAGGDNPFAFCPAVFRPTGPTTAALDDERSRCQIPTDGPPESSGLVIEAGQLQGDYGAREGIAGFVTFSCSRG